MALVEAGTTVESAEKFAVRTSLENPGKYVTLFAVFGLFIHIEKRMNVFTPSSSFGDHYWLNGKAKKFTDAQIGADERATPMMS